MVQRQGSRIRKGLAIGLVGAGVAALPATAAAPGTVAFAITYTNPGATPVVGCSGGFDIQGAADLHWAATDRRVTGEIPDGRLSEVASSADEAYVRGTGHLHAAGRTSAVGLDAVDHGNFLNGVYRVALAHHTGVLVANTATHQDVEPLEGQPQGHGTAGRVGDIVPDKNAVLVTGACSSAGAGLTGQPKAPLTGGPQNVKRVSGTVTTKLSAVHTRKCRVGQAIRARARTVLRSAEPLASGVLTLRLTRRTNKRGASTLTGDGTMRALHGTKVVGHGHLLAARAGRHTDGILTIHLAKRRGFLALNTALVQDSPTTAHGGFGPHGPVRPRNTAVIVPSRC